MRLFSTSTKTQMLALEIKGKMGLTILLPMFKTYPKRIMETENTKKKFETVTTMLGTLYFISF